MIIGTYGDDSWPRLARERAVPSAMEQPEAEEVLLVHRPDWPVGAVRNEGAKQAVGDWLCFLDADDELAPGYLRAMRRALEQETTGNPTRLLLTPAVSYIRGPRRSTPMFHNAAPLYVHNWVVIGTLIHKDLFWEVGGFRDYGDPPGSIIYEDWGLWGRCENAGANIVKVPRAIYLAHQSDVSRNRSGDPMLSARSMWTVGRDVWPEHYPATFEEWHRRFTIAQARPGNRRVIRGGRNRR